MSIPFFEIIVRIKIKLLYHQDRYTFVSVGDKLFQQEVVMQNMFFSFQMNPRESKSLLVRLLRPTRQFNIHLINQNGAFPVKYNSMITANSWSRHKTTRYLTTKCFISVQELCKLDRCKYWLIGNLFQNSFKSTEIAP